MEVSLPAPVEGARKADESFQSLDLPADCTARNAMDLRVAMLDRIGTPALVSIAVGSVERIDTSCLQLLVAFVRERSRSNLPVAWCGTNRSFSDAVELLGLTVILGAAGAT